MSTENTYGDVKRCFGGDEVGISGACMGCVHAHLMGVGSWNRRTYTVNHTRALGLCLAAVGTALCDNWGFHRISEPYGPSLLVTVSLREALAAVGRIAV